MKTILKTAVISTLIFFFSFTLLYAGNGLRDKIKIAVNSSLAVSETQLEKLINSYIWLAKEENLSSNREILLSGILKSNLSDKKVFSYEIEALYAKRILKFEQAKRYILKTLDETPQQQERAQIQMLVYEHKAMAYFHLNNLDSLNYYTDKANPIQSASTNNTHRLKYDEINKKYLVAQENLAVRQNYFMLCMAVAAMIILTFIFLYRSLKMKKKYDELMFNKLNSEISFINSHEIRKYLSNILGIIMVIRISEDRKETYFEFEQELFDSAQNLDNSIHSIATKLNDKAEP